MSNARIRRKKAKKMTNRVIRMVGMMRQPKGRAMITVPLSMLFDNVSDHEDDYDCMDINGNIVSHGEDCIHTTADHGCNRCGYKCCRCGL